MTTPRTTAKAIERAILGVRAAGIEVGRVIIRAGGVVEIVAVDADVNVTSPDAEAITCDEVFNKKARQS